MRYDSVTLWLFFDDRQPLDNTIDGSTPVGSFVITNEARQADVSAESTKFRNGKVNRVEYAFNLGLSNRESENISHSILDQRPFRKRLKSPGTVTAAQVTNAQDLWTLTFPILLSV